MVDAIATLARWVQLVSNLILLGSCLFLIITSTVKQIHSEVWVGRLERLFPWLAVSMLTGLLVILATTIVQVTGSANSLGEYEVWLGLLGDTRVGQIWIFRFAAAILLLLAILYLCNVSKTRWRYALCVAIATLPLIASSLASHAAAEELSVTAVMPYALHLILAGVWFGALPAFMLLIFDKTNKTNKFNILRRFSSVALPVMLLIIFTGLIVANQIFDGYYAALVATPYGWLLSIKIFLLVIILLIAAGVRSYWLPLLNCKQDSDVSNGNNGIRRWVRIEFILALLLLLLATIITNTTPAKHTLIENWPFSFRFSVIATWNQPNVAIQVWSGVAILVAAIAILQLGWLRNWGIKRLIFIPALLFISGGAIALQALTIQAYPETYRRTPVPFDVISVAHGATLFAQHCVECHGPQGMGNGIKSRTLSTKLPDLLIEPHTIEHTPGDFYNWITNGMVNTDMPGYIDKLSDEDRWDLVNYIHALSRGYQARILTPEIVPNKAYVKPPVFSYQGHDGSPGTLQEFRENKAVLMVVFSWPQSMSRLEQLKQAYGRLKEQDVMLLAVPNIDLVVEDMKQLIAKELPFPIVTQGAAEIATSFALSRRTMSHPDIIGRGTTPDHMEFLIDRKGYLRARWIPSVDSSGWSNIDQLNLQINALNREKMNIPFPEDFVQ
ncbi:putative copper resistance protein D [Nitrosomonas ureae]|uniref:Putative copper resistance protein D n=1 Tax=Nitrosomonas ureae TaxID=44577 RepID=A0A285BXD5_9PROT|nr:CopD family protein [Nitrosomonas ureae]SNX59957.1 putative copper resistance protein D [Nitrosomonas ureae]